MRLTFFPRHAARFICCTIMPVPNAARVYQTIVFQFKIWCVSALIFVILKAPTHKTDRYFYARYKWNFQTLGIIKYSSNKNKKWHETQLLPLLSYVYPYAHVTYQHKTKIKTFKCKFSNKYFAWRIIQKLRALYTYNPICKSNFFQGLYLHDNNLK